MFCGHLSKSCIVWYNHIWCMILLYIFLEKREYFLKKMIIKIRSRFIENDDFWLMNMSSYTVHSFSLSCREWDERSWFKELNLKIFKKLSIVFSIDFYSWKIFKKKNILSYRKCLKKWPIDKSIPKSSLSWREYGIILYDSIFWRIDSSNQR